VADDLHQAVDRAGSEELEIPARYLPAIHVRRAVQAQDRSFDGAQPGIRHPVAEHPSHERQQVKVPCVERRSAAGHPEPGDE
jgi:hypothetical protein